jgi:subtilisin family serine protease
VVAGVRDSLNWPVEANGIVSDGTDVIVGIVDTKFDVGHPALRDAVLTVWHQGATGGGTAHPTGRGRVFGGDQIDRLKSGCGFPSLAGPLNHGTDVCAIATGRGLPTGFAPGASVVGVIVHGAHSEAVRGVEWIFDVASSMRVPAVVNVSLGGDHFDPHDGTDLYSLDLDSLTGPGRLVVAAAGNEGDLALHAAVNLQMGRSQSVPVACAAYEGKDAKIFITSRSRGSIRVRLNRGWRLEARKQPATPWLEPGFEEGTGAAGWSAHVRVGDGRRSGEASCVIRRQPGSRGDIESFWWLEVDSPAAPALVNLWSQSAVAEFLSFDKRDNKDQFPKHESVRHDYMVAFPASARTVVAVGGCTALDGGHPRVCHFSNVGPTVDFRPKPELVMKAEGVRAVSPHALVGTSFAAPMVTGVLAAALQVRPSLDPDSARQFLAAASVPLSDTIAPSAAWGFGTLGATELRRAIQETLAQERQEQP